MKHLDVSFPWASSFPVPQDSRLKLRWYVWLFKPIFDIIFEAIFPTSNHKYIFLFGFFLFLFLIVKELIIMCYCSGSTHMQFPLLFIFLLMIPPLLIMSQNLHNHNSYISTAIFQLFPLLMDNGVGQIGWSALRVVVVVSAKISICSWLPLMGVLLVG